MSLFSIFLRIEPYRDSSTVPEELNRAFNKEFKASQEYHIAPNLDYSGIFGTRDSSLHTTLSPLHKPHSYFNQYMRQVLQRMRQKYIDRPKVLFPKYQGGKNVSYETSDNVWTDHPSSLRFPSGHSTLDLERHYAMYGEQIQGPCEMRSAFRYNDLKPRVYYCVGGTAYWSSRYIRTIANDLLELIPACSKRSRYNVDRLNAHIEIGSRITIYDYSSFTTQMAELKNFCHHLSEFMRGIKVYTVDMREGIRERDVGDLISEYNDSINIHAAFSVSRMDAEQEDVMYQANSGMLGVQGNIALSTLLHAINLCAAVDDIDLCNVVGDDAIVVHDDEERPLDYIVRIVNLLGEVAVEKFCSWLYAEQIEKEYPDYWHYCKRPLYITYDGIQHGILPDFPNLAYVFNLEDEFHRPLGLLPDRVVAFAGQVSTFLRTCRQNLDNLSEFEVIAAHQVLNRCYNHLRLPANGVLPGRTLRRISESPLFYSIPAICEGWLDQDWEDVLWDSHPGEAFISPDVSDQSQWPHFYEHTGQSFQATRHKLTGFLEDFGYVESKTVMRYYSTDEFQDKLQWKKLVRGFRHVYEITFIKEAPDWYNDILAMISFEGTMEDYRITGIDYMDLVKSLVHM
ncbi:TPA_asm: hypothetical protein [Armillaria luteobubalina ambi-like virus 1]|uniref:Uncharacterized protein n=1 Tax=Armillaria luteobubalina ambi-like virus 1 TaxID=2803967 RepID=A0A8D9UGZ9_9VIRU|nr:TPA_asm: hypothetical protein [Armillaria luteobubalina ambi-like virus 1]